MGPLPAVTSQSISAVGGSDEEHSSADGACRTPLAVMIDNMRYWDSASERIANQLDALVVRLDDPSAIREAADLVKDFIAAKNKAQACAEAAAPYYHGRVQSITNGPAEEQYTAAAAAADRQTLMSTTDPNEASRVYLRLMGAPLPR